MSVRAEEPWWPLKNMRNLCCGCWEYGAAAASASSPGEPPPAVAPTATGPVAPPSPSRLWEAPCQPPGRGPPRWYTAAAAPQYSRRSRGRGQVPPAAPMGGRGLGGRPGSMAVDRALCCDHGGMLKWHGARSRRSMRRSQHGGAQSACGSRPRPGFTGSRTDRHHGTQAQGQARRQARLAHRRWSTGLHRARHAPLGYQLAAGLPYIADQRPPPTVQPQPPAAAACRHRCHCRQPHCHSAARPHNATPAARRTLGSCRRTTSPAWATMIAAATTRWRCGSPRLRVAFSCCTWCTALLRQVTACWPTSLAVGAAQSVEGSMLPGQRRRVRAACPAARDAMPPPSLPFCTAADSGHVVFRTCRTRRMTRM